MPLAEEDGVLGGVGPGDPPDGVVADPVPGPAPPDGAVEVVGVDERAHHVGPDLAARALGVLPRAGVVEREVLGPVGGLGDQRGREVGEVVGLRQPRLGVQAVPPEPLPCRRPERRPLVGAVGRVPEEVGWVVVAVEVVPGAVVGDDGPAVPLGVGVLVPVGDARERFVVGEPLVLFPEPLGLSRVVARAAVPVEVGVDGPEPLFGPPEVEDAPEDPAREAGRVEGVRERVGPPEVGLDALGERAGGSGVEPGRHTGGQVVSEVGPRLAGLLGGVLDVSLSVVRFELLEQEPGQRRLPLEVVAEGVERLAIRGRE